MKTREKTVDSRNQTRYDTKKEYGNRGADTISTCLEAAEPVKNRERRSRRNILFSQAVCWGAVEQAVHSHRTVEALLFHGRMIYGAVGCKNRCSFFRAKLRCSTLTVHQ